MNNQAASGTSEANTPHESDMPTGWIVRRLKFLATCNDEALPETTDPEFEMEYVDISSVNLIDGITNIETLTFEKAPSRARRVVKDGDTIVSTVRTYLKAIAPIELPPRNMVVSTGFAVIRALEFMDSKYLGYALQNVAFIDAVVANSTGVSYPAINPTALVCLSMSYPEDKATQQQVAAFLDWKTSQIDALIAKKQELLQKLKEKRLAVITQAVTKGLNPDAPMRDSGIPWLGAVPIHWDTRRARFALSANPPSPRLRALAPEQEVSFIPMDAVGVQGGLNLEQVKLIEDVSSGYTEFQDGDVVIAKITPCFENGKAALADGLTNGVAYGTTELHVLRAGAELDPHFLFYVAISDTFSKLGEAEMYGAGGQKRVPPEFIKNFRMILPPLTEQIAIVAHLRAGIEKLDQMENNAQSAITRLTEYRTALITAATTGKIDVRQVKIPASS
ncbi:MAG: restriction endonuclease subunit S [Rhodoferax sp.]|nr:restriction endonuclease subunit S [Rhodoferax sp.]